LRGGGFLGGPTRIAYLLTLKISIRTIGKQRGTGVYAAAHTNRLRQCKTLRAQNPACLGNKKRLQMRPRIIQNVSIPPLNFLSFNLSLCTLLSQIAQATPRNLLFKSSGCTANSIASSRSKCQSLTSPDKDSSNAIDPSIVTMCRASHRLIILTRAAIVVDFPAPAAPPIRTRPRRSPAKFPTSAGSPSSASVGTFTGSARIVAAARPRSRCRLIRNRRKPAIR